MFERLFIEGNATALVADINQNAHILQMQVDCANLLDEIQLVTDQSLNLTSILHIYTQYVCILEQCNLHIQAQIDLIYKAAIQDFYRAISSNCTTTMSIRLSIKSGLVELLSQYGHFLYKNAKYNHAKKHYEQASRLDPDNLNVLTQLGMCCARTQDYMQARIYFETILKRILVMQEQVTPLKIIVKRTSSALIQAEAHALLNIAYTYRLQYSETQATEYAESLRTKAAEYLRQAKSLCPQDIDILAEEQQLRTSMSLKMFTSTNLLFKSKTQHLIETQDLHLGVLK